MAAPSLPFGDLSGLTPHGFCLAWDPGLIWLQAGSDLAIALAYYSIPWALVSLVRRRGDLAFPWVFWLFAAFIMACGTTHVMAVVTLWLPLYWLDGIIKAITAILSVGTAILLWPLLPQALALPSPARLRALNAELAQQVAERDAVAARLRQSEARRRAAYACTPAALHTLDLEGRLVDVSDRWLHLMGYARGEVLGRRIEELLAPGAEAQVRADWQRLLRDGAVHEIERRFVRKGGVVRDVLVSATVERDPDGSVAQVVGAVIDVTDRRATEAALRASEERLRQAQKMQAVGQLTGGVAHDFNNMLTAIMANLELLERRVPAEDPKAARLLAGAMAGAERAARLTSQLLSFSRLQRLEPQAIDPETVIAGMHDLLARSLGERWSLHVEAREAPAWRCLADRNQLELALLNLVLNARAAMPDGGAVTIGIADRQVDADALAAFRLLDEETPEPGEYVVISVADTGHGMTDAVRRRAIEPFFTTRGLGEGTGLGLSQAYGFLRQSGGALHIASAAGQGTRVDLLLPRALVRAGAAAAGLGAGEQEGEGRDDEGQHGADAEQVRIG